MSVLRERVGNLVKTALAGGAVTLLIAPPGFGKTIALRDSLGDETAVRWIECPRNARVEDIVREFITAVAGEHLISIPTLFDGSGNPKDFDHVLEWTAARLRSFDGTIVLDDLHRCFGDPQAVAFIAQMMETTASHIRWVGASREVPLFPIGTWIASGLMVLPITDDELAFDLDEAAALAKNLRLSIDREILDLIIKDTEGWPMAVHLALQLWDRTRSMAPLQIRTREVLFAQMESELWPRLEADVRDIIVACALLPEVNSAVLTAAKFANAEILLERAHRMIPFVQKTVDGGYALHDLFAEFIQKTIRRDPADTVALRQRLACGLASSGRHADAVRMLVAAGEKQRVIDALAESGFRLIEQGNRAAVAGALAFLSAAGEQNHAAVCALRGVLSWADGSASNAEALYTSAFERNLPREMRVETAKRLATVLINKGEGERAVTVLAPMIGDETIPAHERIELRSNLAASLATAGRRDEARAALERVVLDLPIVAADARARILQRLGYTAYFLGDMAPAASFARDAAQLATDLDMWYFAALSHSVLYHVASLIEPDSSIALGHARMVTVAGKRAGNSSLTAMGLRYEYLLYALRGDESAFEEAEAALAGMNDIRTFRTSFTGRFARALADTIRGMPKRGISALSAMDPREHTVAERALREALLALLMSMADRRDESLDLLKTPLLVEVSQEFTSRRYVNLARMIRGVALWSHDRTAHARRSFFFDEGGMAENDRVLLTTSVEIFSNPRNVMTPETIAPALDRLRTSGWGGFATIFAMLFGKAPASAGITPAEIRVLRAFRHGGNTEEIAHMLGRSPHTIEAQLKSVYRKIGCVSRAEALVYARTQGWLDDAIVGIPEIR